MWSESTLCLSSDSVAWYWWREGRKRAGVEHSAIDYLLCAPKIHTVKCNPQGDGISIGEAFRR